MSQDVNIADPERVQKFYTALEPLMAAAEISPSGLPGRREISSYLWLVQTAVVARAAIDGILSDQWLAYLSAYFANNVPHGSLMLLRKLLSWSGARFDLFYGASLRGAAEGIELRRGVVENLQRGLDLAAGRGTSEPQEVERFWRREAYLVGGRLTIENGAPLWSALGTVIPLAPLARPTEVPGRERLSFYDAVDQTGLRYLTPLSRSPALYGGESVLALVELRLALGAFLVAGRDPLEPAVAAAELTADPTWLCLVEASRAFQLYQGADYVAAAGLLRALPQRPRPLTLALLTARALTRGGSVQEALERLGAVEQEAPPASAAFYSLAAELHLLAGDRVRAVAACEKALSHHPSDPALEKRRANLSGPARRAARAESAAGAAAAQGTAAGTAAPAAPGAAPAPGAAASSDAAANGEERVNAEELVADMNREAAAGLYGPVVGREDELAEIIQVLRCRQKNNPLLIGDAGVGKSVIVEALAQRLVSGRVPAFLRGRRMYRLSLARLLAGSKYRGALEERVFELIDELKSQRALLFVDDFHTAVAAGANRPGTFDVANLFKPALARGDLQIIGATSFEEYRNSIEKDGSFARIFQLVRVEEPTGERLTDILDAHQARLARHHRVSYEELQQGELLELAGKYLTERAHPDKAIDVLDRAGARVALELEAGARSDAAVRLPDAVHVIASLASLPYERIAAVADAQLLRMEDYLRTRIVGQEDALGTVARVVRTAKMDLSLATHERPEGIFLFVGPTGVGKTELARALTEYLFGSLDRFIRIDMSEYMERISSSRLIGAAPGYVGYNDPNQLTDKVRKNPYSLILLDEIEKADSQLLSLFLQVFDAGRLTDGKGRSVSFKNTIIIMTSNIGSEVFSRLVPGYGRRAGESPETSPQRASLDKEIRRFFAPEFLNRLDETVFFRPLDVDDVRRIAHLQLASLSDRLARMGKTLEMDPDAIDLLAREGYSFEFGARNLGRTLRRRVLDPLAEMALEPGWPRVRRVVLTAEAGSVRWRTESAATAPAPPVLPQPVLAELPKLPELPDLVESEADAELGEDTATRLGR